MYTVMYYEDFLGLRVNFLADPDPDGFIAVTNIEHQLAARSERRGKSEDNGSWPTFTYYESLTITLEGSIQAVNSTKYNTFTMNTAQILMPQPLLPQRDRIQGSFNIRHVGNPHNWEIPVSVETPLQLKVEATSPSRAEFQLAFIAFRPYYYEPATNRYLWHP